MGQDTLTGKEASMPTKPSPEDPLQNLNMNNPYANPQAECDLVMKGGITSGVVYPPAILELAKVYRLRSIGGTSAGAIAAAIAAATEYGREKQSYFLLEKIQEELKGPHLILSLFRPSPTTRPLYRLLLDLVSTPKTGKTPPWWWPVKLTRSCSKYCGGAFALGAAIGIGFVILYTWLFSGFQMHFGAVLPALLPLLLFGWLGGLLASGLQLYQIIKRIPKNNFFGLCTGMADPREPAGTLALTEWLHEKIQNLAQLSINDPPLTFQMLLDKKNPSNKLTDEDIGIELKMVTTNLSQSRPYVFPTSSNMFLFKKSEMDRLFPASVVAYLVEKRHIGTILTEQLEREGYYFLPSGAQLPVVVAMRMSLSFPFLLSAVPLYTIKETFFAQSRAATANNSSLLPTPTDLQPHWFSDGGICSNFPIHFFDNWFPTRPTFGINLSSLPKEAFMPVGDRTQQPVAAATSQPYQADAKQVDINYQSTSFVDPAPDLANQPDDKLQGPIPDVYLPKANVYPPINWTNVSSVFQFAGAILDSARNYRDTMQAILPGYRERIVQIRFAPGEGGLNLAMDETTIANIQGKGKQAGTLLSSPHDFNFEHHQWVRLRVLLPLIQRQLKAIAGDKTKGMHTALFAHELMPAETGRGFPYPQGQAWITQATALLEQLIAMGGTFAADEVLNQRVPQPEPVLRVTRDI